MTLSFTNAVASSTSSARKLALVMAFCVGAGLSSAAAHAGDVDITVSGVRSGGDLHIGLQSRGEFMKNEGSFGEILNDVRAGTVSVTLKDVPDGEYAASIWHDIDGDGVFDADDQGMPLDGWSMTNAASLRGAPTFDQVSISVVGGTSLSLDMVYPN